MSFRHEPEPWAAELAPRWAPLPADWGVSLVIPAYNEEDRIGATLEVYLAALERASRPFEVIVVCDGKDHTPDVVRRLGNPHVRTMEYPEKLGRGGAIFKGLRAATREVIAYADADGSVGPEDLIHLIHVVGSGEAVAIASRRLEPDLVEVPEPHLRRFIGWVWHALIRAFLGIKVRDVQCGLKVFRAEVVEIILREVLVTNRTFEVDMIYHICRHSIPINEVAVAYHHDFRTRMPITKAVPVMFLFLIGIFAANNRIGRRLLPSRVLDMCNSVFSTT
ncbi:MAG: glycosyltransferase [Thermoplasmata archaeon]